MLKYAGISSFMHYLKQLKISVDMGDEIFQNMREGNWFIDYTFDRLGFMKEELQEVIEYVGDLFEQVKKLPHSFRPKFGALAIEKVYNAALKDLISFKI